MKTLEFIYQDTQIHFLLNPTDDNVMVNATEMAKLFKRRTKDFLKTDHAKAFIQVAERALNGARSENKIIDNRGHMGIYFDRRLALKFAAWLSPEFEFWVFDTLDKIIFGHLKEFRDLLQKEVELKNIQPTLKQNLRDNPCSETVEAYFLNQSMQNEIKRQKRKVVNAQLSLFEEALNTA